MLLSYVRILPWNVRRPMRAAPVRRDHDTAGWQSVGVDVLPVESHEFGDLSRSERSNGTISAAGKGPERSGRGPDGYARLPTDLVAPPPIRAAVLKPSSD
jgi:hypothetical protein